jgi:hypothetical protein
MGRVPGILFFTGRANAENAATRLYNHPILANEQNADGDPAGVRRNH